MNSTSSWSFYVHELLKMILNNLVLFPQIILIFMKLQCSALLNESILSRYSNDIVLIENETGVETHHYADALELSIILKHINGKNRSNLYSPELSFTSNQLCSYHLKLYKDRLHQNRSFWATKMLDSSAQIHNGILEGNVHFLGQFEECIDISLLESLNTSFTGQYCIARYYKLQENMLNELKAVMELSICIPSSCSASDWQRHLRKLMEPYNASYHVNVKEIECQTKTMRKLDAADWVAGLLIVFVALLVVASTSYDIYQPSDSKKKLYIAFSLYSNGIFLLDTSINENSLQVLNGLRVLSCVWVVIFHHYLCPMPESCGVGYHNFKTRMNTQLIPQIMLGNTLHVDTFLVISGLLVSYVFFNKLKNGPISSFRVLPYYIHRYCRLTPVYVTMVMLQATLMAYMASGPLWPHILLMVEKCRKSWWFHILYINNYVNTDCGDHTWYLALDMQLYFISPLLLIPMLIRPRLTLIYIALIFLLGTLLTFLLAFIYNIHLAPLFVLDPEISMIYFPTYTRYQTWLMGLVLGWIIKDITEKKIIITKEMVAIGWFVSTLIGLLSLYLRYPLVQEDHIYNNLEVSFYFASHRFLWALSICWLIFACVSGYGGPLNVILSWKFWIPLSRLSYCLYIVHYYVLIVRTGSTKGPKQFDGFDHFVDFLGSYMLSTIFAVALYLGIEQPFSNLANAIPWKGFPVKIKSKQDS